MTEKKKISNMTFKEFVEEGKASNDPASADVENEILRKLHQEGFTDEQIYALPAVRILNLYREVFLIEVENGLSALDKALERNPALEYNAKVREEFEQLKLAVKALVKDDQQEEGSETKS